ncbi:MAG: 50S ribosomal protein L3 N(5)-glutamine methyltransferase [Gammaproteobacteria bacterium]|nr:50S ribosomal protein L3 N(5)-glutamine methyltransferase [Gammaproteobacteria bacterium]
MKSDSPTPRSLVLDAERRFDAAGLYYGHGTDNARDEAVYLVFHTLGLPFDAPEAALDRPVDAAVAVRVEALVARRITERLPAAYLTKAMWFAGHEFYVDERVLVPRSPIAELILEDFAPWVDATRVERVLDIGTGSACIAIAAALQFPGAHVDATDVSTDALAVAAHNVERHGLGARVFLHRADLFPAEERRYDVILANPPYVPLDEMAELPPEYTHEPALALAAGDDGLDLVRRILDGAAARLRPGGILVMDTGATWPAVEAAFPGLPFIWVELAHGGDGIFVLHREDLPGA